MKSSIYLIKAIILVITFSFISGCTFFEEKDFDEERLVNFRGGGTINGQGFNWLGFVSFNNGGTFFTATSATDGSPSNVVITINEEIGKTGQSTGNQIQFRLNGVITTFNNCTANLAFDTLTAQVNLRGNVVGRSNGNVASFQFEDAVVNLSQD